MKEIKIAKSLKGVEYYMMHLNIINPFLPNKIFPKEIEVLSYFMSFEGELAESNRFSTEFRKIVKQRMNISDGGLGNHLNSLKLKEFIVEGLDGKLTIAEVLFPENNEQHYHFKIRKE